MSKGHIEFGGRSIELRKLERAYLIAERDPAHKLFVVSFPKSGRTWMRVMISRYKQLTLGIADYHLYLHRIFSTEPHLSPQVNFTHAQSNYPTNRYESMWFLLSRALGASLDTTSRMSLERCRGAKLVFVCRDPRDVILSYYHHRSKRLAHFKYRGSMTEFVRDEYLGLPHLIQYMNFVAEQKERFDHRFTYYEDLRADAFAEMNCILSFAGFAVDQEALRQTIEFGSLENMRKLERSDLGFKELSVRNPKDPDSYKVRKGKVGSYRTEMSPEDVAYLDEQVRTHLHPFYERYR